jgi:cytoskeleton protein RodZ
MNPLNVDLKLAREQKKITLKQIADQTHITLRQLENLEEGRYSQLPGGMYNRAFLRAYCECLGLDATPFLARYEAETPPPSEKPVILKPRNRRPLPRRNSLSPVVIWSVMLLISIASLLYSRKWIADVFSPYFSRSQEMVLAKPPVPNLPQSQPAAAPVENHPAAQAGQAPAPSIPAALPTPEPEEPPAGTLRLEFEVVQKCWVSVSRDGDRVLVKLLEPGEDLAFDAVERFYVILGNAGGVRLKINGKRAKPPGNSGEVVKMKINTENVSELLATDEP